MCQTTGNTDKDHQEWLGGDPGNVQTNFFSRGVNELGDGTGPGNSGIHGLGFNAVEGLHTYTLDWTPESITFYVDGQEIRKAEIGDPAKWPQTPMQVKIGIWAGGHPDNSEGTIEWAGGPTNFDDAPFTAWYKSLKIVDYCGGKDAAEEYVWSDDSGLQDSIEVVGAKGNGGFTANGSKSDVEADDPEDDDDDEESTSSGDATKTGTDGAESTDDADAAESEEGDDGNGDGEGAASIAGLSSTLVAMVGLAYLIMA